jgi:hypothetical protein
MALADLMKKGFLTSATATPATPATHKRGSRPTVATVAVVAVTKLPNFKALFNARSLDQFRFDLVQSDIDSGYPADDTHRVNNMAWEFMQADQMAFDEAIKLAAEIIVNGKWSACERAYVDVLTLFMRLQPKEEN